MPLGIQPFNNTFEGKHETFYYQTLCIKRRVIYFYLKTPIQTCKRGKEEDERRAKEQGKRRLKQRRKEGRKGGRKTRN